MVDLANKNIEGFEYNKKFTSCPSLSFFKGRRFLAINDKYLAILLNEPGKINIALSNEPRNLSRDNYKIIEGVDSNILDLEFSPFDSNILAYSNNNKSVILARINDEINNNFKCKNISYSKHSNEKVNFVNFNPIALNVMCSCALNGELHVWDSNKLEKIYGCNIQNNPFEISWNPDGSLIGISSIRKEFFYYDPRNKSILPSDINSYSNQKFAWIDNNSIASIEFKPGIQKYLRLIDIRKTNNSYSEIYVDNNNYETYPFVDNELKIIYTVGKYEKDIKIFDYSQGKLQKCKPHMCSQINNFSIFMNRRYLDKNNKEIDRLIRYTASKEIYYVGFKDTKLTNQNFIENIYPNEDLELQHLTSEQWFSGKQFIKKKLYIKKSSEDKYQVQYKNSFNTKEQDNNNSKSKFINMRLNSYVNKYKNNQNNNESKKDNIQNNSNNIGNEEKYCNSCNNLRNIIQKLEIEKKALEEQKNNILTENKNYEKKNNDIIKEYKKLLLDPNNIIINKEINLILFKIILK